MKTIVVSLIALSLVVGCGRKGDPTPPKPAESNVEQAPTG